MIQINFNVAIFSEKTEKLDVFDALELQRWKPVGSTGTGRVTGRVEILRPAGQAG